jgi:hypothetical protein
LARPVLLNYSLFLRNGAIQPRIEEGLGAIMNDRLVFFVPVHGDKSIYGIVFVKGDFILFLLTDDRHQTVAPVNDPRNSLSFPQLAGGFIIFSV